MQKILQEKHKTKIKKKEEVDLMCKINGKKLEEARTNAGMTQRELAELSGVSQNAISHYENGKTIVFVHILAEHHFQSALLYVYAEESGSQTPQIVIDYELRMMCVASFLERYKFRFHVGTQN